MSRFQYIYAGSDIVETIEHEVDWFYVRKLRNNELKRTDFWALKDLTMSQEKKDYRIFLRNLPQEYDTANEAYDALDNYNKPE